SDLNINEIKTYYDRNQAAIASAGGVAVKYAAREPWLLNEKTPILSFTRYLDPNGMGNSFLEVEVEAAELFTMDITDKFGDYELTMFYQDSVIFTNAKNPAITVMNTNFSQMKTASFNKDKRYFIYHHSEQTPFAFLMSVPEKSFLAPLRFFQKVTLATIIMLIVFSLSVFYFLSKILTYKLYRLKKAIDSIELADQVNIPDTKYPMDEIEWINRSFVKMQERLKISLEETIHSRTMQLKLQFDSLQLQINPHFLFNMIGVINGLAEEGDTDQIEKISQSLSNFLRYTMSTDSPIILFEKELEFTISYLNLLKSRYMERLTFEIDISDAMLNIWIPKLTLQPLIENCIQHGLQDHHPLNVRIKGEISGDRWSLSIYDNGSGFAPDKLNLLRSKIDNYLLNMESLKETGHLSFGGMGILNTLARLKLRFKDHIDFTIGNIEDQGAYVTISAKWTC
ncbi:MAG TPA: histidine kinase, partial [Bacilli bacterium]